jgi:hypothetical protein
MPGPLQELNLTAKGAEEGAKAARKNKQGTDGEGDPNCNPRIEKPGTLPSIIIPEGDTFNSPGLRSLQPWVKVHVAASCRTPKEFRNPGILRDSFRVGCPSKRTLLGLCHWGLLPKSSDREGRTKLLSPNLR